MTLDPNRNPDRQTTVRLIRDALKRRSGKTWSVTQWGGHWIRINDPSSQRTRDEMPRAAQVELADLLGLPAPSFDGGGLVRSDGLLIEWGLFREYIGRAEGRTPTARLDLVRDESRGIYP